MNRIKLIILLFVFISPHLSQGQTEEEDESNFDPFSDYSEYMQTSDEEADINFFRSGRMLSIGLYGGARGFTQTLSQLYGPGLSYGLGITYFFDLRFAGHLSFLFGDYPFEFNTSNGSTAGNVSLTFLSYDMKYYFNTDLLIRPIADINPYWLIGFNQTFRTLSLASSPDSAQDSTLGLDLALGIEIPIMRKQAFWGLQVAYRFFEFKDENQPLIDPVTQLASRVKPAGDSLDFLFSLGLNF